MLSIPYRGRRGSGRMVVAPGFVNYKKGCTRLAAASDKGYQLLAHGRWFSPGTSASSTTKTGRHDIAEILMKVALNSKNQSINRMVVGITTTCAISVITTDVVSLKRVHYVIKFVSDMLQVGGFHRGHLVSSTNKTDRHDITEIFLKVALNTINHKPCIPHRYIYMPDVYMYVHRFHQPELCCLLALKALFTLLWARVHLITRSSSMLFDINT